MRFYAGVPLKTADGIALGALCVLDTKPNRLTPSQAFTLRTLAPAGHHQPGTASRLEGAA